MKFDCCIINNKEFEGKMNYLKIDKINDLISAFQKEYSSQLAPSITLPSFHIDGYEHPEATRKLLEKINSRMRKQLIQTVGQANQSKVHYRNWVLGQYKLFRAILVFYSIYGSISTCQMKNQDIHQFQEFFYLKSPTLIHYQIAAINQKAVCSAQWQDQENTLLSKIIQAKDNPNWKEVALELFQASDKKYFRQFFECREHWNNHLNPNVMKKYWTLQEDLKLFKLVQMHGLKWSLISKGMNGVRNEHMVKNRYNSMMRKFKNKGKKSHQSIQILQIIQKLQLKEKRISQKHVEIEMSSTSQSQKIQTEDQSSQIKAQQQSKNQNPSLELDEFCIEKYFNFESIY